MKVILANPRGFCAGVDRAITIVERALDLLGPPIYVRHEVVHNRFVVEQLRARGAIFVEEIEDVPAQATVIFSAHGVAPSVRQQALAKQLKVFDATCPLVTKVHIEVVRHSRRGEECILIGHRHHPEVDGTLGQYNNPEGGIYLIENESEISHLVVKNPEKLFFVTQTTLSVDDTQKIIATLTERFPFIQGPKHDDICYATQNRQDAIKKLAKHCDVLLVVGSVSSSNSNRLRELGERLGCRAYLLDDASQLQAAWLQDAKTIGVSAGASAPEVLVQNLMQALKNLGAEIIEEQQAVVENIYFALPAELRIS